MFYYLNGEVALFENNLIVLDCGGVGYAVHTSSYSMSKAKVGQKCKLYTYCNIREDAFDIFGFASKEELGYFEKLIGVNGVGPKVAVGILSALPPERFALAVLSQDEKAITAAPGVGKKLAQRIIMELKDKLGAETSEIDLSGVPDVSNVGSKSNLSLAQAGLAELGYSQAEINAALKGINIEGMKTEDIIRQCLRAMVMR